MSRDDITQIRVDRHTVGIIGLQTVMEEMKEVYAEKTDDEIRMELIKKLSQGNYIPPTAMETYGNAFLREFKKFMGIPWGNEKTQGLEVRILGQGCAQCDRLEQEVLAVVSELNLPADIQHVKDIKDIGRYGVMGMPALVVNGKVKCVGKVPLKSQLMEWLREATKNGTPEKGA